MSKNYTQNTFSQILCQCLKNTHTGHNVIMLPAILACKLQFLEHDQSPNTHDQPSHNITIDKNRVRYGLVHNIIPLPHFIKSHYPGEHHQT